MAVSSSDQQLTEMVSTYRLKQIFDSIQSQNIPFLELWKGFTLESVFSPVTMLRFRKWILTNFSSDSVSHFITQIQLEFPYLIDYSYYFAIDSLTFKSISNQPYQKIDRIGIEMNPSHGGLYMNQNYMYGGKFTQDGIFLEVFPQEAFLKSTMTFIIKQSDVNKIIQFSNDSVFPYSIKTLPLPLLDQELVSNSEYFLVLIHFNQQFKVLKNYLGFMDILSIQDSEVNPSTHQALVLFRSRQILQTLVFLTQQLYQETKVFLNNIIQQFNTVSQKDNRFYPSHLQKSFQQFHLARVFGIQLGLVTPMTPQHRKPLITIRQKESSLLKTAFALYIKAKIEKKKVETYLPDDQWTLVETIHPSQEEFLLKKFTQYSIQINKENAPILGNEKELEPDPSHLIDEQESSFQQSLRSLRPYEKVNTLITPHIVFVRKNQKVIVIDDEDDEENDKSEPL